MYLSIRQHDLFRTLLMGFEIPYRGYIADVLMSRYPNESALENVLVVKNSSLHPSDPFFLRNTLPSACDHAKVQAMYDRFSTASTTTEIVAVDQDMPMVGALNIVTFALTSDFQFLYNLCSGYGAFCDLAEKYRYARNKLDHPGCRTLEERHLIPVLSFVKDICLALDDKYFIQKSKADILSEVNVLQQRRTIIPISKHNLNETPYPDSQIVCRNSEIEELKSFIYGNPGDLRKQHSRCVYGYGGVGKTALVIEVLKQIVQDINDNKTTNDYKPEYLFFYSAKKRQLRISDASGNIIEQQTRWHFETADELISLIHESLGLESFKGFHDEGLIVVDNLETLSVDERKKAKHFIESQTPAEMQFLLTSRNSEEYESNKKLSGFEISRDDTRGDTGGDVFVHAYIEENALDLQLAPSEIDELLKIAKGNTLVLVLCLRRLSKKLIDFSGLKADFSSVNVWKKFRDNIANLPPNAYESISDFMFKDTFEQIETVFTDTELFYKILKVFAVISDNGTDLSTICLLTECSYPEVEAAIDTLCSYLIVERNGITYSLNQFAETYIIQRFVPDSETFDSLSKEIEVRQHRIRESLEKLESDMKTRRPLANIMRDWHIITDSDRITAAKMYHLYGDVKAECNRGGRFKVQAALENFVEESIENEKITAHPFVKFQKARILRLIDSSNILQDKHTKEIRKSYLDAIYTIKTVDQYAVIQSTKSYAALLWLYGQFLSDQNETLDAIRILEDGKDAFENQSIMDTQYFQCLTLLGKQYLRYFQEDPSNRVGYLKRARIISRQLQNNRDVLGTAFKYAIALKNEIRKYDSVQC